MTEFARPPADAENMVSLKVDNLSYRTTKDDLYEEFQRFGEVGDIYIPRDRDTRESRGFAFVRFYERRDAELAMEKMDGQMFDDRELRVQKAKYGRPSRPPSNRGRYGGGDRYGGGGGDRGSGDRYGGDRSRYSGGGGGGRGGGGGYSRNRRSRSRSKSPRRRRSFSKSPKRNSPSRSRSRSPPPKRSSPAGKSRSRSFSPARS